MKNKAYLVIVLNYAFATISCLTPNERLDQAIKELTSAGAYPKQTRLKKCIKTIFKSIAEGACVDSENGQAALEFAIFFKNEYLIDFLLKFYAVQGGTNFENFVLISYYFSLRIESPESIIKKLEYFIGKDRHFKKRGSLEILAENGVSENHYKLA